MRKPNGCFSALAGALAFLAGAPASADGIESFYAGRQVRINVGAAPGGGYDLYARLLARHLGKHIPGHPTVIASNMPGAVSIAAANYLANSAPKDGTELLAFVQTLPMSQVAQADKIHFDLAQFNFVGNMTTSANVFVSWRNAPVRSLADAKERELVVGATAPNSVAAIYPTIVNKVLGTKFKIVLGYANGEAVDLAMERGEVGGRAGTSWAMLKATRADHLRNHDVNVFLQVGLRKEPELPDVPLMSDLARSDADRQILQFYSSLTAVAHAITLGPGVPADRVAAMRDAFDATMRDPEFLAEAARQGFEIDPLPGARLQEAVTQMVHTNPAILDLDKLSDDPEKSRAGKSD